MNRTQTGSSGVVHAPSVSQLDTETDNMSLGSIDFSFDDVFRFFVVSFHPQATNNTGMSKKNLTGGHLNAII